MLKGLLAPAVSAAFALCIAAAAAAEKPLRVAVIQPLSGEAASAGESLRNGITLALEHAGSAAARLQVIFEDDRLDPKTTVTAYRKLMAASPVDVLITISSGTSNAAAPLAEHDRVPMISIASDPAIVAGRRWVVNFWVTPEQESKVAFQEAQRRGYRRVARITTSQEGWLAINRAFDRENRGRIAIAPDDEYLTDNKDFRPFISKVRQARDIDAVFVLLLPGQLGTFARQAREQGLRQPFFGFEMFEEISEVTAARGALDGQWYVNYADAEDSFLYAYRQRFPGASTFAAANGYDAINLLLAALQQGASRESVNRFLHSVKDFSGAMGTYSASGDNCFTLPAAVKVVPAGGR